MTSAIHAIAAFFAIALVLVTIRDAVRMREDLAKGSRWVQSAPNDRERGHRMFWYVALCAVTTIIVWWAILAAIVGLWALVRLILAGG